MDGPRQFLDALLDSNSQPNLFTCVGEKAIARLREVCRPTTFSAGETLFRQSEEHRFSYIVESGLVRTYYTAPSGHEVILGYWSKGDLVGGPSVLGGGVHIWSGTAASHARVLPISGAALKEIVSSDPELCWWIIEVLGFKCRWISILFQIHGTENVSSRLAKLLTLLAENFGESTEAGIALSSRISQGDLGAWIGASRQWTNKSLTQLKQKGLLAIENRQIIVKDVSVLRRLAEA